LWFFWRPVGEQHGAHARSERIHDLQLKLPLALLFHRLSVWRAEDIKVGLLLAPLGVSNGPQLKELLGKGVVTRELYSTLITTTPRNFLRRSHRLLFISYGLKEESSSYALSAMLLIVAADAPACLPAEHLQ